MKLNFVLFIILISTMIAAQDNNLKFWDGYNVKKIPESQFLTPYEPILKKINNTLNILLADDRLNGRLLPRKEHCPACYTCFDDSIFYNFTDLECRKNRIKEKSKVDNTYIETKTNESKFHRIIYGVGLKNGLDKLENLNVFFEELLKESPNEIWSEEYQSFVRSQIYQNPAYLSYNDLKTYINYGSYTKEFFSEEESLRRFLIRLYERYIDHIVTILNNDETLDADFVQRNLKIIKNQEPYKSSIITLIGYISGFNRFNLESLKRNGIGIFSRFAYNYNHSETNFSYFPAFLQGPASILDSKMKNYFTYLDNNVFGSVGERLMIIDEIGLDLFKIIFSATSKPSFIPYNCAKIHKSDSGNIKLEIDIETDIDNQELLNYMIEKMIEEWNKYPFIDIKIIPTIIQQKPSGENKLGLTLSDSWSFYYRQNNQCGIINILNDDFDSSIGHEFGHFLGFDHGTYDIARSKGSFYEVYRTYWHEENLMYCADCQDPIVTPEMIEFLLQDLNNLKGYY
ncbi:MAG: hypothetical protein ABIA04_05070 [Pseudomonadota bacterium]